MKSTFQYAPDWKGLLANFLNYRPRILILEELPAGDIPSFFSTADEKLSTSISIRLLFEPYVRTHELVALKKN